MEATPTSKSSTLATGLAMFSMFFGAGNVVFPLAIGRYAQDQNIWAMLGMFITAIGVPFLGLISCILFNGNYKHYFERIGKWPGFIVTLALVLLIGPFGATPRTIALSFSAFSFYWDWLSLPIFSFISCVIIFFFTYKKSKILDLLGFVLTPFLLGSVMIIIVLGLIYAPEAPVSGLESSDVFWAGLFEGYQTMDLLATYFFSSVVITCLEADRIPQEHKSYRSVIFMSLKASAIGASLLTMVYVGFSFVSSYHSVALAGIPTDKILPSLALDLLGPYAGIIAIIAVGLACLTTAIALVSCVADFLHQDILQKRTSYITCLLFTLGLTFVVSTLSFEGIVQLLIPVLQVCYPALIVLAILNIAHKLHHFQPVKVPFFVALGLTLIAYWL